ncbi:MAG: Ig-like domain-containing protein [Deltaproteobacteria bacterium]|nr:Ig-like domain-containing protein [Deltaproteobacteria bacterium]
MKKVLRRVLYPMAAAYLAAALFGCAKTDGDVTNPNPNEFKPKGTIQGRLLDTVTQQPIAGAVVDIGVAKATTTETGQFVLRNVPATTDDTNDNSYSGVSGSYKATVDLRAVNSKRVADAKAASTPTNTVVAVVYPNFAIKNLEVVFTSFNDTEGSNPGGGAGSNHDTPIDYLADGYDLRVGKLDSHIDGLVVMKSTGQPVGAGYTVKLAGTFGSDNNVTGTDENVIATATTDANGRFLFSNVEAQRSVCIRVWNADKTIYGHADVSTLGDNETLFMSGQKTGSDDFLVNIIDPIFAAPLDDQDPFVVSVTPESGSDLDPAGAGNNIVTFTFSEPILGNAYTNGLTASSVGTIYEDVAVTYSSKAGNVAHTLAWSADRTQLIVTIAALAPSGSYNVDIDSALDDSRFTDLAGNGVSDDNSITETTFTTNGAPTPAQPAALAVVTSAVDWVGDVALDWAVTPGAKTYNLYCAAVQMFEDGPVTHQAVLVNDNWDITASEINLSINDNGYTDLLPLVENNEIARQYSCYVTGVSSDHLEGPASDPVTIADTKSPSLTTADGALNGTVSDQMPSDGNSETFTVNLGVSEPLQKAGAADVANYTLAATTTLAATDVIPELVGAAYQAGSPYVTLTLKLTNPADAGIDRDHYSSFWSISLSSDNIMDVAGNTFEPTKSVYTNDLPVAAPPVLAVTFVNQNQIDFNTDGANFDWLAVTNAKTYGWTCDIYEAWGDDWIKDSSFSSNGRFEATAASISTNDDSEDVPFVEYTGTQEIQKLWQCTISAYSLSGKELARSTVQTVKDLKAPKLNQPVGVEIQNADGSFSSVDDLVLPAAGETATYHLLLQFNEPMREEAVETLAAYVMAKNATAAASDVAPVVTGVTYDGVDGSNRGEATVTVTLTNTTGATYTGQWSLTLANTITDIAGNGLDTSKAIYHVIQPSAGAVTLSFLNSTLKWGYNAAPATDSNPRFDWLPVSGAVDYELCGGWAVAGVTDPSSVACTSTGIVTAATDASAFTGGFVTAATPSDPQGTARTRTYQLFAYGPTGTTLANSEVVSIADTVAPKLASPAGTGFLGGLSLPAPAGGDFTKVATQEFTLDVFFNEPVNLAALENAANYSLTVTTGATAPTATEVVPVVSRVNILNNQQARLVITVTNPAETAAAGPETSTLYTNLTLNVNVAASQADVKGNALDATADQVYNASIPTSVTTNPF